MDVRRFDQGAAKKSRDSQGWGTGSTYCSRTPPQTAAKAWTQGQAATTDSLGDMLRIISEGQGLARKFLRSHSYARIVIGKSCKVRDLTSCKS